MLGGNLGSLLYGGVSVMVFNPLDQPSLKMIVVKQFQNDSFEFNPTNHETVTKIIDKFNPPKKLLVLTGFLLNC